MYAVAIEEVLKHVEAHRAYLRGLKEKGWLLASGPLDPRHGGALLLRVPDDDVAKHLDRVRDDDPFVHAGVAQYEGKEDLDRL